MCSVINALEVKDNTSLLKLQERLKDMFQFQSNDLNFGIFKIFKLKQVEIEKFINNKLEKIVEKELKSVSNNEEKADLLELKLFLHGMSKDELLQNIDLNYDKILGAINVFGNGETEKLKNILSSQRNKNIEGDFENKIYNYILNYFDLYYSNGDFGYNTRSLDSYKVEYDENYNGSDVMFHWKHKGSYYIKTGNGFNSIKFDLDSKAIEFVLETNDESENEEITQNNNKDTSLKHYKLDRIEKTSDNTFKVIFILGKTSTSKADIFRFIFRDILNIDLDDSFILNKDGKPIFKDLGKDFDKTDNGNKKGFSQLRIKKDDLVKKYNSNFPRGEKLEAKTFDELNSNNIIENTIINLWSLDNKLNSFYIGNDSDYFIHEDLKGFLTKEKEKFIKNNILGDLSSILNAKIDNTTLIIAKIFNNISDEIIEFLSAVEEFQKGIFEMKKKVLISEYCITLDKVSEDFYSEILSNKKQIEEWKNLGFIEDEKEVNLKFLKNNKSLSIDTKFFNQTFKDNLLNTIDNLEDQTNGLLINSENFQALNVLMNKYRGKVKCIYIDPPYNTGGDGFVYKDSFKHSSWLCMMENRLTLARDLLTDDGVIFVSIDDREFNNLKFLLDSIFGVDNLISTLVWEKIHTIKANSNTFSSKHEYLLSYSKNINNIKINLVERNEKQLSQYKNKDNDKRGVWNRGNVLSPKFTEANFYEIEGPNGKIYKPKKGMSWRYGKEKMLELIKDNRIIFEPNMLRQKLFLTEVAEGVVPETILYHSIVGHTQKGTEDLTSLFGDKIFAYPKPTKLIKYLIQRIYGKAFNILDFFSGSGTTQQAVIELNKEDGGNRKYIGVEMGEYFDTVTKPRVQKVIYSSDWKNGKPENNKGVSQIMKYQVLEQYEDILDKLEIDNDDFPIGLDLKYLYRKEEVKLKSTLDLRKPFENNYVYGREKKNTKIDLIETYNYIKGYEVESIRTYEIEKKYYKVVKTGNTLVIWRNIEILENDIKNIEKIVLKYNEIEEIEVNKEIYSLERDKFGRIEIGNRKIEVSIINEGVFCE